MLPLGVCGFSFTDVANDQTGSCLSMSVLKDDGREFNRKQTAIFAFSSEFAGRFASLSSLLDKGGKSRVGDIDQALSACGNDLFERPFKDLAGCWIGVKDGSVGRGLHDAVHAILKKQAIKDFAVFSRIAQ